MENSRISGASQEQRVVQHEYFFLEVQNRMLKRVAGVRNGKQDTIDRIADNMEL